MPQIDSAQNPPSDLLQPRPEDVRAELRKLLESRHLKESRQLQSFLMFVVEETLAGRREGLKEYVLGCHVFGRKADYDPRHDGIVRVQATTLRKRLERYYSEDGAHDEVVIELPRGGYVPSFRRAEVAQTPKVETPQEPAAAPAPGRRSILIAFLSGAALVSAAGFLFMPRAQRPTAPAFPSTGASVGDFPAFWTALVQPKVDTLIAYGVPLFYVGENGMYFRDVQVNVPGDEQRGRIRDFAQKFHVNPQPTDDTYTGVGEVEATALLSSFLGGNGIPVKVTNARALGVSDLTSKNLVVVSSLRFQTVLTEMKLPRSFAFLPERPETIENLQPLPGEERLYRYRNGSGVSTSYALVSVWPGLNPERRIVHIGGVHTWSTQAATQFLLDPVEIRKLSAIFEKDKQAGPRGVSSPFFQILLRVEGRSNHSQKVEYVTHHYLPSASKAVPASQP